MRHLIITGLISTALFSHAAIGNPKTGKELHESACQSCHDNGIYTRSSSIIHSYSELQTRVEFCEQASQQHWNEEQAKNVTEYLNETFYKFPKN